MCKKGIPCVNNVYVRKTPLPIAWLYVSIILPVVVYVVEALHQVASRTGRKKVSIFLKTKDVGVVQPGNMKASAPRDPITILEDDLSAK